MSTKHPDIRILPDFETLSAAGADLFSQRAQQSIAERGRFLVALAGGETPLRLYQILAEHSAEFATGTSSGTPPVPWTQTHVFWTDERLVPPEDPNSNYGAAWAHLLSRIEIPYDNLHPVATQLEGAGPVAAAYEDEIRKTFDLASGRIPVFDLVLLGMGEDGHVASLFPQTEALNESHRLALPTFAPTKPNHRVSLTFPVLNAARCVVFVIAGTAKANALHEVIDGGWQPKRFPAQLVRPEGGLIWLVDEAAATRLEMTGKA